MLIRRIRFIIALDGARGARYRATIQQSRAHTRPAAHPASTSSPVHAQVDPADAHQEREAQGPMQKIQFHPAAFHQRASKLPSVRYTTADSME